MRRIFHHDIFIGMLFPFVAVFDLNPLHMTITCKCNVCTCGYMAMSMGMGSGRMKRSRQIISCIKVGMPNRSFTCMYYHVMCQSRTVYVLYSIC